MITDPDTVNHNGTHQRDRLGGSYTKMTTPTDQDRWGFGTRGSDVPDEPAERVGEILADSEPSALVDVAVRVMGAGRVEILADGEPSALGAVGGVEVDAHAVEILADGEPSALAGSDRARPRGHHVEILADGEPSALACGVDQSCSLITRLRSSRTANRPRWLLGGGLGLATSVEILADGEPSALVR